MLSFIVPPQGRASLRHTLASIDLWAGDELIVVGPAAVLDPRARHIACEPAKDWGATERTLGIAAATQPFLAFMDDDDVYAPGARALMQQAIKRAPTRPILFRLEYPNGTRLWADPVIRVGNVSTQMMLIPNDPDRLGSWRSGRRESDFDFLASSKWRPADYVWQTEVICHRSEEASR